MTSILGRSEYIGGDWLPRRWHPNAHPIWFCAPSPCLVPQLVSFGVSSHSLFPLRSGWDIFLRRASLAIPDGALLGGKGRRERGRLERPSARGWVLGLPPLFGASPFSPLPVRWILFHLLGLPPPSLSSISGGPLAVLPRSRRYTSHLPLPLLLPLPSPPVWALMCAVILFAV